MPSRFRPVLAVALLTGVGSISGCESGTLAPSVDELQSVLTLSAFEMTTADTVEVQVAMTNPTPYPMGFLSGNCGVDFFVLDSADNQVHPTGPTICNLEARTVTFYGHETKVRTYHFHAGYLAGPLEPGTYRFYPGSPQLHRWPPAELHVVLP